MNQNTSTSTSTNTNKIVVIDYGMGNLHSVASALSHVAPDAEVVISADPEQVRSADRVVFPGVGAIRDCMGAIRTEGVDRVVAEFIATGKPLLAICVGMQALLRHSEENQGITCLGLLAGEVRFFGKNLHDGAGNHMKVPHMGWNQVQQNAKHPLWEDIEQNARFYFVHSFYVACESVNDASVAGTCDYNTEFVAAISKENVFAVQFHPEKSHTAGLQLLRNFSQWNGQASSETELEKAAK